MPATIKDVAVRAGVSVGSVSRVVSNNKTVKSATREKVEKAIQDLGFKPNFAARALRTNQTDTIGLIVPDVSDPYFARLAKCIEAEATRRNQQVMLANSNHDAASVSRHMTAMLDRTPAGILVAGERPAENPETEANIPIVSLDARSGSPFVSTDYAHSSAKMADLICEYGHRRITYLDGPEGDKACAARHEGFTRHIERKSSQGASLMLAHSAGNLDHESGEALALDILGASIEDLPTAIVCANDQMAIGALRAARSLSIHVPEELTVVGFGDIDLASLVEPRLTTIRQPIEKIAETAMRMLTGELDGTSDHLISGELVIRSSSGPAPDKHATSA